MRKVVLLFGVTLLMSSCISQQKILYFQDLQLADKVDYSFQTDSLDSEMRFQSSDILSIIVTGKDPMSVSMFNLPAITTLKPNSVELSANSTLQSYLIDENGCINFPTLGSVKIAGLTRAEAVNMLTKRLSEYIKEPIVNLQLLNFKVSVLGEVNSPGVKQISNEKVTIMDAISLGGDMNIYGNRSNVLLIRQEKGKKMFCSFDFTSSKIFKSKYFYLKQNDIVYVQPNSARQNSSRIDSAKQFNLSLASTITGVVSVIASLCIALFR